MDTNNVWTEKYRPQSLDDVIGQKKIVEVLKKFVEKKDLPHLMFSGPPGCGKTTASIALTKELFGNKWRSNLLELNASDESTIDVMRGKVKDYTRTISMTHSFKLVFMDECDHLSRGSQAVLRRIIEKTSETCRFILSCNYPNKIIPAIADRCAIFRFTALKPKDMQLFLRKVKEKEEMNISDSALYTLAVLSDGSMRRALNLLQVLKLSGQDKINDSDIYEYMYWIDYSVIKRLLVAIGEKDMKKSDKIINEMLFERAYNTKEVLKGLYQEIKEGDFDTKFKLKSLDRLNEVEYHISVGSDPDIQLKTYCAYCMKII